MFPLENWRLSEEFPYKVQILQDRRKILKDIVKRELKVRWKIPLNEERRKNCNGTSFEALSFNRLLFARKDGKCFDCVEQKFIEHWLFSLFLYYTLGFRQTANGFAQCAAKIKDWFWSAPIETNRQSTLTCVSKYRDRMLFCFVRHILRFLSHSLMCVYFFSSLCFWETATSHFIS